MAYPQEGVETVREAPVASIVMEKTQSRPRTDGLMEISVERQ